MHSIPLFNLKAQHQAIRKKIDHAIRGVLDSHQFILGMSVDIFEKESARFLNCRYALGVASGTDAILLSLAALGAGPGDEVITSPHTFFGTVGPILHLGAKPVFIDIDPRTYNLNPSHIAKKISSKTKVILPVHMYGQCAEMTVIRKISQEYHLSVVEDGAQAFGAIHQGKRAGTWGELGAFSFYPSKNLGACGDGGLIVGNQKSLMEKIRMLRVQGARRKYIHEICGYNSRLDSIQAAILGVKLKYIDQWNQARRKIAEAYDQRLKEIREVKIPYVTGGNIPIYHLYTIRAQKRDRLIEFLKKRGIETGIYYPLPQHLQKAVHGYKRGDFPETERAARETLTLPIFPELKREDQEYVVSAIKEFY